MKYPKEPDAAIKSDWYKHVKSFQCLRCGDFGSEANHFEAFISSKTGLVLPRSHKGRDGFGCFPLCESCHRTAKDSFHNIGERNFIETQLPTSKYVYQWFGTTIRDFFLEREGKI